MLAFTTLALSLLACSFAAPYPQIQTGDESSSTQQNCGDLSKATLVLPEGSPLPAPRGPPKIISLGVGTQNYTCSDEGTYASVGAVATLYDLSCLAGKPILDNIADIAIAIWDSVPDTDVASAVGSDARINAPEVLGHHFFVPTESGSSPKWDLGSKGSVVAAKAGSMAAPTGAQDVDWLALDAVEGDLASQIFRVDTREGQPPASCTAGSDPLTVKYVALYYFN